MSDKPVKTTLPPTKRPWWVRLARGLGWLFLLACIFHRPLVHHGGRWLAIQIAKTQNLALDFSLHGNLWSGIEVRGIRANRIAAGPSPVERLTLDRASAGYDLWKLIRGDIGGLQRLEIGTLDAEVRPVKSPRREKPAQPLAQQLRTALSKTLPAPLVTVTRADIKVVTEKESVAIANFRLQLSPGAAGFVAWDSVELPGLQPLPAFRSDTRLSTGRLIIREQGTTILDLAATKTEITAAIHLLGSRITANISPQSTGDEIAAKLSIESLDATAFASRAGIILPMPASLPDFTFTFTGAPESNSTWKVTARGNISTLAKDKFPAAKLQINASMKDRIASIETVSAEAAGATFRANGQIPLGGIFDNAPTEKIADGGRMTFDFAAPDLSKIEPSLRGGLSGKGTATIGSGVVHLATEFEAASIGAGPIVSVKSTASLHAELPIKTRASLRDLSARLHVESSDISANSIRVDKVRLAATLTALRAEVSGLSVQRGTGSITATGSALLDEKGKLSAAPEARFDIAIPSLAEFGIAPSGKLLAGEISGTGNLTVGQPFEASKGSVKIHGKSLTLAGESAGNFDIEAQLANGALVASQLDVRLPGKGFISGAGQLGIAAPYSFTGKIETQLPDLSAFAPILALFGEKRPISGAVNLTLEGKGDPGKPDGSLALDAKRVKFANMPATDAGMRARFSKSDAEITEFSASNEMLQTTAKAAWKNNRATLSDFSVKLDGQTVLTGQASAPLIFGAGQAIPQDQPVSVKFQARDLDVTRLLASLGKPTGVAGKFTTQIEASGTLKEPRILIDASGSEFRVQAAANVPPTAFETRTSFEKDTLEITGTIRQPLVQPVKFTAKTTLHSESLLAGKLPSLDAIPLNASLDLPTTPLEFLPRFVPAISKIDGTVAVALKVAGTVAKPAITGSTTADVRFARFENSAIPVLTGFKARIDATGDRITLTELGGEAGGGRFGVTGSITITDPAKPEFDLALKSKDVLVLRDDSVLVRAETDITLRGPLNSAAVSGTVHVVQSRFNKEIEILPLALPGKPKPAPAAVAPRKTVSFPNPPLRDWTFNVAVKTRVDDPFLIRGNLAKGKVALDVRLAGTGRTPYLTGAATVEQFSAVLPLSTLTTRRGLVTFSEDMPFEPRIELEAESTIRQYTIVLRLDGPASKPRLDLESEPPLPQQEILSLLTTGSLSGEVGSNNTAMATRAAVLVVKSWYKKLFKRDFPLTGGGDGDSLLDRFEVDFGAVDPKTGRNETTAQLRVTDRLFFIGDLQLGGGFSGRVKYLFRFR